MSDVPTTNAERTVWQAAFERVSGGRCRNTVNAVAFADDVLDFLREVDEDVWAEVGKIERKVDDA